MSIQSYSILTGVDPSAVGDLSTKRYADSGRRSLILRYIRSAAYTFSATAGTPTYPFLFDAASTAGGSWDVDGNYNTSTGLFTAPVNGAYIIEARIGANLNASGQSVTCSIYLNGASFTPNTAFYSGSGSSAFGCQTPALISMKANDTVGVSAAVSLASATVRNNVETHLAVALLGGY